MKKRIIVFVAFTLILPIGVNAQKKVKLPKKLLQTWELEYAIYRLSYDDYYSYEAENKFVTQRATIRIEKDAIYIDDAELDTYNEWDDYEDYDDYNYDYAPREEVIELNIEEDRAAPNFTVKEGSALILEPTEEYYHEPVKHIKWDSKSGAIILIDENSYYSGTYKVLVYDGLGKSEVKFLIGYDFYSEEEAEEKILKMKEKLDMAKAYVLQSEYNRRQSLPIKTELDRIDYLDWWKQYAQKLKSRDIEPTIGILTESYEGGLVIQEIFLDQGYNPYSSVFAVENAITKYGFDEKVKDRIRGRLDEGEVAQTRNLLMNNWYSLGSKVPKIQFTGDEMIITYNETTYLSGLGIDEQEETTLIIPLAGITFGYSAQDGGLIVGPVPDSLSENYEFYDFFGDKEYTLFNFKIVDNQNAIFSVESHHFAAEDAEKSELGTNQSSYTTGYFVSESKVNSFDGYLEMPILTSPDEFDSFNISLENKLSQYGLYAYDGYYDLSYIDATLYPEINQKVEDYFVKKGYHPYKSLKNFELSRLNSSLETSKYWNDESISYDKDLLAEARRTNDKDQILVLAENLNEYKIENEYIDAYQAYIQMIANDEDTSEQKTLLRRYALFDDLKIDIDDLDYYREEIKYTLDDLEAREDGTATDDYYSDYDDYDYDYYSDYDYEYYLELYKTYPQEIKKQAREIYQKIEEAERNNTIIYADQLRQKLGRLEDYAKTGIQQDLNKLKRLARKELAASYKKSLREYKQYVIDYQKDLLTETDPIQIESLTKSLNAATHKVEYLELQLEVIAADSLGKIDEVLRLEEKITSIDQYNQLDLSLGDLEYYRWEVLYLKDELEHPGDYDHYYGYDYDYPYYVEMMQKFPEEVTDYLKDFEDEWAEVTLNEVAYMDELQERKTKIENYLNSQIYVDLEIIQNLYEQIK